MKSRIQYVCNQTKIKQWECDYYVITELVINLKRADGAYYRQIEINRERKYNAYSDDIDSDGDDYAEQCRKHKAKVRTLWEKPDKIVFSNGQFVNNTCKQKYEGRITHALNCDYFGTPQNTGITIKDVESVVKSTYTIDRE